MSSFKITLTVCFGIFGLISLITLAMGGSDSMQLIGLFGLLLSILYLFAGLILCFPSSSREIGKAVLLSSAIILVIGISVCSMTPLNFH